MLTTPTLAPNKSGGLFDDDDDDDFFSVGSADKTTPPQATPSMTKEPTKQDKEKLEYVVNNETCIYMYFCSSSVFGASSDFAFGQDDDDNLFLSPPTGMATKEQKQPEATKESPEVRAIN